jgi:hypothetical protein
MMRVDISYILETAKTKIVARRITAGLTMVLAADKVL